MAYRTQLVRFHILDISHEESSSEVSGSNRAEPTVRSSWKPSRLWLHNIRVTEIDRMNCSNQTRSSFLSLMPYRYTVVSHVLHESRKSCFFVVLAVRLSFGNFWPP